MSECTFISMISTVSYVKVTLYILWNSCVTAKKASYLSTGIVLCCSWGLLHLSLFCLWELIWSRCPPHLCLGLLCPTSTSIQSSLPHPLAVSRSTTLGLRCWREYLSHREVAAFRLVSFLLHHLAVVLGSRLDRLPSLADSRLDTPCLSLADTSGLTLRHWDMENVSGLSHKLRHPHDVFCANQIVELYITFVLRKVFKLFHII